MSAPIAAEGSLWRDAWLRLTDNRMAVFGGAVMLLLILLVIFVPLVLPYSYATQDLILGATPPSTGHWFGTDTLGRDLLARVLYGGRISLAVGGLATLVALLIGVFWGTLAGYVGGRVDNLMMRVVDILYGLPFIIFIVLLMVVFGRSLFLMFVAIGAVEWLTMARIIRGQVAALRRQEFVMAAEAMGVARWSILYRHLVPNVLGTVVVYATLTVPSVMILEAFLSFLGLGVQPPMSSWGLLIREGVETMEEFPWLLMIPGLLFSLTLFCLNFLGDGLRDALDPRAGRD